MENGFHSVFKVLFVLKTFSFLPLIFDNVGKWIDKKAKVNFKLDKKAKVNYDVTEWTASNYNTHMSQYLKKYRPSGT